MAILALGIPAHAPAQGLRVAGQVVHASHADTAPLAALPVVLHGFTFAGGAAVDSALTDGSGRFLLRGGGGEGAANYVVSVRYAGIDYLSEAVTRAALAAGAGVPPILVYDTSSTGPPIRVAAREIAFGARARDGSRFVAEVVTLANREDRTRVAPDSGTVTWRGRMPDGVVAATVEGGDVAREAVRIAGAWLEVVAPLPPGSRRIVLHYVMPRTLAAWRLASEHDTEQLVLHLPESGVPVEGVPFTVSGLRYAAEGVPAGTLVRVRFGRAAASVTDRWWVIVVAAALALAGGFAAWWRRQGGRGAGALAREAPVA